MRLSDTRIRSVKPRDAAFKLSDGKGLHLEVRPTGTRLWRYRYRIAGRENIFAIGEYPEVSLSEARHARDEARKLVRAGVHPSHHRKAERLRAHFDGRATFAAVANEWLEDRLNHKGAPWARRTYRQRKNLLKNDVFPEVGSLPMRQVTPAHAFAVVKAIEKRAPQMAVIARQCFSAISQLAIATARADVDLGYPLRSAVKTKITTHKRPLREAEIPAFMEALVRYTGFPYTKVAIQLLWWTLARPSEVIGAAWSEFDLDNALWSVPASRMKMSKPHVVPLPTQAVARLRELQAIYGAHAFLVPNRNDSRRPASVGILAKVFVSMGYDGKFTPHAVRVTGRTILGEQGHPHDVLERQLAHRQAKHVRAYNQGDRLEARRIIMQGWADHLDRLKAGSNVVNIKAARAS